MYYLYIKTHNKTGLRYLGQTKRKDFHKYTGSGIRWLNHLNKHGFDYTTHILLATEDKDELKETGKFFSNLFNIVESNDWANLKPEEGDGGQDSSVQNKRVKNGTHHFLSEEHKNKQRKRQLALCKDGNHIFQNEEFKNYKKERVKQKVLKGEHHFQDKEAAKERTKKMIEAGSHNLLGPEINRKRLENGTHNFLDKEAAREEQKRRIENGSHPFLNSETQSKITQKRLKENRHNFQNKIYAIDREGNTVHICKQEYHSNKIGPKETWLYVNVNSKEARNRKNNKK